MVGVKRLKHGQNKVEALVHLLRVCVSQQAKRLLVWGIDHIVHCVGLAAPITHVA